MKKAIQIPYDDLFETKCALIAKAGFAHISINFDDRAVHDFTEQDWKNAPAHILRTLEAHGLSCVQTHLPYYHLLISAEILDDTFENNILQSIEVSGKIGASWCVYHPRTAENAGYRRNAAFEINKKVIAGYIDHAIKHNTGIALENLPIFTGIRPATPFYSSDYGDLAELCDTFQSPAVAICWDFGHANLMRFKQEDAIRYLGKRIQCTHVHNNFGVEDDHLLPDHGTIPWDKVMPALKEVGFDSLLTLETHCRYYDEALWLSFAKHNLGCLEYLEKLYG